MRRNKLPFCAVMLVGIIAMVIGFMNVVTTQGYKETQAIFNHVEATSSKNSDGSWSYLYTWYYDFDVNGEKYTIKSEYHGSKEPQDNNSIALYDPASPENNILKTERINDVAILIGLAFIIPGFLVLNPFSKEEDTEDVHEKKFVWMWVLFCFIVLALLFASSDYNIIAVLDSDFLFILVILIFLIIGIVLLVKAYSSKKTYSPYTRRPTANTPNQNLVEKTENKNYNYSEEGKYNLSDDNPISKN